jgi:hypothetical protein
MGKEQHPTNHGLDAAIDQAAAACRDTYDHYQINLHDEHNRLVILTTMNLFAQTRGDYGIAYLALARLLDLT